MTADTADPKNPDLVTNITPAGLSADIAERFKYCYAVRAGRTVWISGQVSMDGNGQVVGVGDIEAQSHQVFANLGMIRAAIGGEVTFVETTTYMVDRNHSAAINEARKAFFVDPPYPTSNLIVVAGLARPEFLVEISAIALVS